jgi:hypothetical protein
MEWCFGLGSASNEDQISRSRPRNALFMAPMLKLLIMKQCAKPMHAPLMFALNQQSVVDVCGISTLFTSAPIPSVHGLIPRWGLSSILENHFLFHLQPEKDQRVVKKLCFLLDLCSWQPRDLEVM